MHKRGITAAAVAATTVLAAAVATAGSASAAPSRKAVPHTLPAWTAHATNLGHASSSAAVNGRVYLAPRGGLSTVAALAAAQATPGNADYRKFLTPAQYQARFGPTSADVNAVASVLKGAGLKVGTVGAGNRYIAFSGNVHAAEAAFGTRINRYGHAGTDVQAPSSTVTVPASIGSAVLTVTGLDTTPHRTAPSSTPKAGPPAGFRNARPCSQYFGQIQATTQADGHTPLPQFNGQTLSYAPCGYVGSQFRSAYEGSTSLDGSGVTVAITDAYAAQTIVKDVTHYAANHGDRAYARGQFVQTVASTFTDQKECGPSGWYGEETLDVEAVHAMAQGANIHYYGAASCNDSDLLDTLGQVVDDGQAQLVTNSWGDVTSNETSDNVAAYEAVFLQGATEGMSFMFSSGDNGDELAASGLKQADYPTSDPYVTSVGGTSTAIGQDGSLSFQTGWGTDKYTLAKNGTKWSLVGFLYGAGGGRSTLFNAAKYQQVVTGDAYRDVPDVAMDADPNTGMLIGETQKFSDGRSYDEFRIGGTSLASPLFAGMTALAIQNAGSGVGLLNQSIYHHRSAFTDVLGNPPQAGVVRVDYVNGENAANGLVYSVRTFDDDSSLATTPGYDLVTGLGTPNQGWFSALS